VKKNLAIYKLYDFKNSGEAGREGGREGGRVE
jgi:hypothetical protein